jgi:hypothetical protein
VNYQKIAQKLRGPNYEDTEEYKQGEKIKHFGITCFGKNRFWSTMLHLNWNFLKNIGKLIHLHPYHPLPLLDHGTKNLGKPLRNT